MFKKLFANLLYQLGVIGKEGNGKVKSERILKLETTMQIIFNEIVGAMAKEPRVAQLNDDELVLGVAQILMEERLIKTQMEKQRRIESSGDMEFTKTSRVEAVKKTRTYH